MKNYRSLLAILLTLMMVFSIFMMVSNSLKKTDEVEAYLAEAKALHEEGLYGKAAGKYGQAIELYPDVTYYYAAADMYYDCGQLENSIAWCEETLKAFPEEAGAYERMIRACLDYEQYKDAFEALAEADGRKVASAQIETYRERMKGLYFKQYISIDQVAQTSGGCFVVGKEGKWGIVSNTGSTILSKHYSRIGAMAGGIVAVCNAEGNWYLSDEEGVNVANLTLNLGEGITDVSLYNEGLFAVCVNGSYRYYDIDFNAVEGSYTFASAYNAGVAAVQKDGVWQLIDADGKSVNGEAYEQIVLDDRGLCCLMDRVIVQKDGKYLLLDGSGKRVGNASFEEARLPAGENLIAVKVNGLWGFADLDGNMVIEPQYEDAQSFSNDMAAVCVDGRWGYIDEKNHMCIEPAFLECRNMTSAGTALIHTDRGWNLLKLYSKNY